MANKKSKRILEQQLGEQTEGQSYVEVYMRPSKLCTLMVSCKLVAIPRQLGVDHLFLFLFSPEATSESGQILYFLYKAVPRSLLTSLRLAFTFLSPQELELGQWQEEKE